MSPLQLVLLYPLPDPPFPALLYPSSLNLHRLLRDRFRSQRRMRNRQSTRIEDPVANGEIRTTAS